MKTRLIEFGVFVIAIVLIWHWYVGLFWQPLFFAVLLAVTFHDFFERLCRQVWISDSIAALMVAMIALLIPVIPAVFAVYYSIGVADRLISALRIPTSDEYLWLSEIVTELNERVPFLAEYLQLDGGGIDSFTKLLTSNWNGVASVSRSIIGTVYTSFAGIMFGIVVALLALYYFLKDGKKLLAFVKKAAPVRVEFVTRAFDEFVQMTRAMVKVTIIVGFVQGAIGGAALWFVGTPSALMWTFAMMLLSMMPILGAGIVLVPTSIIYFFTGDMVSGSVVLGTFAFVSVVDNILKPKIIGGDMSLNEGLILLSVVAGLATFGAIGMFAGPILFALLTAMIDVYLRMASSTFESKPWQPYTPPPPVFRTHKHRV